MNWRKAFLRVLGRFFLYGLIIIVRVLPLPLALMLGRGLGTLTRLVSRRRYETALKNLRIAYGNSLSAAERERIARDCFQHFGMFVIESIKFPWLSDEEIARRLYVREEEFALAQSLFKEGKGCLLITGHLGSFELPGRWLSAQGHELIVLARETRDRATTNLMTRMRQRNGMKVVTLGSGLKPVLAGLKRNACIGIVCDQNASDVFVPFFGQPTGTVDGPARIALKTGAPMLFAYCLRDGRGHYMLIVQGTYRAEPTSDMQADIARVMTEVNRRHEEVIRAYPEQWLWFHDRWRSSPHVKDPAEEEETDTRTYAGAGSRSASHGIEKE